MAVTLYRIVKINPQDPTDILYFSGLRAYSQLPYFNGSEAYGKLYKQKKYCINQLARLDRAFQRKLSNSTSKKLTQADNLVANLVIQEVEIILKEQL